MRLAVHEPRLRCGREINNANVGCAQASASPDSPGLMAEAEATLRGLESALTAWELAALLGGPYDSGGAVVSIQVGAQGASDSFLERDFQTTLAAWELAALLGGPYETTSAFVSVQVGLQILIHFEELILNLR